MKPTPLIALSGLLITATASAYNGFDDCTRYTHMSAEQQKTYTKSIVCVPIANTTKQDLTVTLMKSKTQGDTRTINEGNVGEFTHSSIVPKGTAYNIIIKDSKGKTVYNSVTGKDAKAVNLVGLICLSLNSQIKCVPWDATRPKDKQYYQAIMTPEPTS